jgi:aerobic carbon-monoxide dehydrogenase small subunit
MEIKQSFTVDHPPARVWAFFAEIEHVVPCMPGAALTAPAQPDHVEGKIGIKLGPIQAAFAGSAELERDEATLTGTIRGQGRDNRSNSRAKAEIRYAVVAEQDGAATRVDIVVDYSLAGSLAQFSRGGIVNDLAGRLTEAFADNLRARLDRDSGEAETKTTTEPAGETRPLNAGALLFQVIWARIKAFFSRRR